MLIVLTFLLTSALWAAALLFAVRRVVRHMQSNPEAVAAISTHLLVPLFGKREKPE